MFRRTFVKLLTLGLAGIGLKVSAQALPKPKGRIFGVITVTRPPMVLTLYKVTGFRYEVSPDPRQYEMVAQIIRANQLTSTGELKREQEFEFKGLTPGVYRLRVGDPFLQGWKYDIDDLEITEYISVVNVSITDNPFVPVGVQYQP